MATMQTLPISLPLSIFLSGGTSMLVEQREQETIKQAEWQDGLINLFSQGQVTDGKGIVYNYEEVLGSVEQYTETSSLMTLRKPSMLTEYIWIDTYEFTATSIREPIAPESFANGTVMSSFLSILRDRNRKTLHQDLTTKLLTTWNGYTPTKATQTVTIQLEDPSLATSASDYIQIQSANGSKIATAFQNIYDNLSVYSLDYTDTATAYSQTPRSDVSVILNRAWLNDWTSNALVNAFNSDRLENNLPSPSVALPAKVVTNPMRIATMSAPRKFALVYGYRDGQVFRDPSNQFDTYFEHRSCGYGVFLTPACIEVVASYGTTPPPVEPNKLVKKHNAF